MYAAPTLEARAQKARSYRKNPGASGRLHRTEAGDWVWSSDSEDQDNSDEESDDEAPPATLPPVDKGAVNSQFIIYNSFVRLQVQTTVPLSFQRT